MNQTLNITNSASTHAAMGYARKLAAEGKTISQIAIMVRAAGFRITDQDAADVCERYQQHLDAVRKAMRAGS
jgi:hypothetical protein